jgi:putative phosphonate metabolism protein
MRVAIYYAPAISDPLWSLGSRWLGRDAETNAAVVQPNLPGIAELTADPRMYGFHATLKPPMALAAGQSWDGLVTATEDLASRIAPFDLPRLAVTDLRGFMAITDAKPSPKLQGLADACVTELDAFRAPAGEAELARRRRSKLTEQQDAMLVRWGYPYVLDTWFFHMTLTRRMTVEEQALTRPVAEAMFVEALTLRRRVADICLYTQSGPGAPFVMAERLPLRGAA